MKTIYMIYAILFKNVSVLRYDENLDGLNIIWAAHDQPQDGQGGHNGKWAEGPTPQDAAWNLRRITH